MPSLFPTQPIIPETAETVAGRVKFGSSWKFDFESGEFLLGPTGKISDSKDVDAWLEWCKKAVQTERYRYLAYGRLYGQEFDELIALHLSREGNESEIKRMVSECLTADPRTKAVEGFIFTWEGDQCHFTCTVTNVRDENGEIQGTVVIG